MNEAWKDILGYEGIYQVSNLGRVKSLSRIILGAIPKRTKDIILKLKITASGYVVVNLNKNGKYSTKFVHRLVADAFLPNRGFHQVNHKDENKQNNFVFINPDGSVNEEKSNLEWCTSAYNANYGTRNERMRKKKMKRVNQYTKEGMFIRSWESITTIQKETGMSLSNISLTCTGKSQTAFGYIWKYEEG